MFAPALRQIPRVAAGLLGESVGRTFGGLFGDEGARQGAQKGAQVADAAAGFVGENLRRVLAGTSRQAPGLRR